MAFVRRVSKLQCESVARGRARRFPLAAHASIDTYDDHRMAMCFSLAALGELAQLRSDHAEAGRIYRDMLQASSAAGRWSEVS